VSKPLHAYQSITAVSAYCTALGVLAGLSMNFVSVIYTH